MEPLTGDRTIRLAKFEKSASDDYVPLCTLRQFNLDEAPAFNALSYTWKSYHTSENRVPILEFGDEVLTKCKISVNGQESEVSENLYRFLCRWASLDGDGYFPWLWVDSICINQKDLTELSSQVRMMTPIFSTAENVIVWLGEEDRFTKQSIDLITNLATTMSLKTLRQYDELMWSQSEKKEERRSSLLRLGDWKGAYELLLRPWFFRAWIVQEITVARRVTILCGRHEVAWNHIVFMSEWLSASRFGSQILEAIMIRHRDKYSGIIGVGTTAKLLQMIIDARQEGRGWDLSALLTVIRSFKATEPRDKIFATLGIVHEYEGRECCRYIPIDYTLSVEEVFTRATRAVLNQTGRLGFMSEAANEGSSRLSQLPSWVPDYSAVSTNFLADRGSGFYKSGTNIPTVFDSRDLGNVLPVKFLFFDTIEESSDVIELHSQKNDENLESFLKVVLGLPELYCTAQGRLDVLWRTLIGDIGMNKHPADESFSKPFELGMNLLIAEWLVEHQPSAARIATILELFDQLAPADSSYTLLSSEYILAMRSKVPPGQKFDYEAFTNMKLYDDYARTFRDHRIHWHMMKLFRTCNGYLGLGPRSLRPGDTCWLAGNAKMPFILRKASETSLYRLIGEAYIHGIMHGEVKVDDSESNIHGIGLV